MKKRKKDEKQKGAKIKPKRVGGEHILAYCRRDNNIIFGREREKIWLLFLHKKARTART